MLVTKKAEWTAAFLAKRAAKPGTRPESRRGYAHPEVRAALEAMSHYKCFYCERSVKGDEGEQKAEVDHYIEVAQRPELAFEWTNLYLACRECNKAKMGHATISVEDCLDPCDETAEPEKHLIFEDECIRPRSGSPRGRKTITKYGLDRPQLDQARTRALRNLDRLIIAIQRRQIQEGRRGLTDEEREAIQSFAEPEHPFSLMFRAMVEQVKLEPST